MPIRRTRQRTPHYDHRRRVVKLGGAGLPWWDPSGENLCIWAAYQAVNIGTFAASILDISGNGNDAGDPGGAATPPWDAVNGWRPDGIADYLTTAFLPQNDHSQSVVVQYTNVTDTDNFLCGMSSGANISFGIEPTNGAGANIRYYNGGAVNVVPALLAGNIGIAGIQGYRNGVADGPVLGVWVGAPAHTLYIACRNLVGVAANFCACNIRALALYDCILTAPQMLAVATAMAAL